MGRHVLRGELATTLWNQPYNGALDAYLLAPLLAALPPHAAYRLYEALCAALLVALVGLLARRLGGPTAGWAGALLAAWGTPYMALMTATGPPPNFLMPLVTGFPLVVALAAVPREGRSIGRGSALGLGFACGLAVWNSSLAIPAFAGMAVGLVLAGLRPRLSTSLAFAAGLAPGRGAAPRRAAIGASGASVVTAASAVTALRPRWLWEQGLLDLGHALLGLAGLQVPLVVDGTERADLPAALACSSRPPSSSPWLRAADRGARCRSRGGRGPLAGAFCLSRRPEPDELRYLYGLNAPVLALAGVGLRGSLGAQDPPRLRLGLGLLAPWGLRPPASWPRAWRDPAPRRARLGGAVPRPGPRSALRASRGEERLREPAVRGPPHPRVGGTVIASQAWNERIPGDPLRFRDEVDLDPRAAWVLSPHLSRGMPRADGFRELLRGMGGSFRRSGGRPRGVPRPSGRPTTRRVRCHARRSASRDRRRAHRPRSPRPRSRHRVDGGQGLRAGSGVEARLDSPRRLDAFVLAVDLEASPLAVPWVAELDGHVVAEGPARHGLQWVNGAPRAARQALLVVPLAGRAGQTVRLLFQGSGPPLRVIEAFLYGPDERASGPPRAESERAFASARAGRWYEAARLYAEAMRLEPDRASHHAACPARWRAAHRQVSTWRASTDGGPELVGVRSPLACPDEPAREGPGVLVPAFRRALRNGKDTKSLACLGAREEGATTTPAGNGTRPRPSPGTPPRPRAAPPRRTSRGPGGTSPRR